MKEGIHPIYQEVLYKDISNGFSFLSRSTKVPAEKEKHTDGKEYPVIKIEISSASHPFFTGTEKLMDTQGRIERFNRKFNRAK